MPNQSKTRKHAGKTVSEVDAYSVIECRCCGFKHVWPFPTAEELAELYDRNYYTDVYPLSDAISDGEIESSRREFGDRLEHLESLLPPDRRTLLDIGAGNFGFLFAARERGWDVLGIEPSEQGENRAEALGIPFICDYFSPEVMQGRGPFDLINLNCVLEHLLDPIGLIETAFDFLAPGGILSVCVPNDFNPLQTAFIESQNRSPWWVVPLQHINYFDTRSLPRLLEAKGLAIEKCETTFPIELFLLFGDDYVSDASIGTASHQRIARFEARMKQAGKADLLGEMYAGFERLGLGRRLLVTARKPAE